MFCHHLHPQCAAAAAQANRVIIHFNQDASNAAIQDIVKEVESGKGRIARIIESKSNPVRYIAKVSDSLVWALSNHKDVREVERSVYDTFAF
ncbi:hypothetical protein BGX31_006333 [Mortierella sp. GBA43]|nr:hypothetical protein BGX31_006333 [Mortierella sp. GBA43]